MSNILDYLKWRQDLSFESDYFNCVDSLVLSRAAYLRWELIFSKIDKCTISKAYEIFNEYDLSTIHILAEEDPELFKLLATSKRFKDCEVSNFVNEVDEVKETQFCGLMFHLSDGTNYIAFRGTDNTIVGWKEDLKMSFQDSVISQKKAVRYLNKVANLSRGKIRVGGHSKGGNLAVYSSLYANKKVAKRIIEIDNFDGPGLSSTVLNEKNSNPLFEIIQAYYPQNSIIGRLLFHDEKNRNLIESTYKGIYQHDLYSWQIIGKEFVRVLEFDKRSEIIDGAIKEFMLVVEPSQRKQCIDLIFDVISSTNTDTFSELSNSLMMNAPTLIKSMTKVDSKDRKVVIDTMRILTDLIVDEMKTVNKNESS